MAFLVALLHGNRFEIETYMMLSLSDRIGIGGDYPVSAVITSEFAPSNHRARMLATVFYMQPLGYLTASLVTLVVTLAYRNSIPSDLSTTTCDDSCRRGLDRCWRIIIAFGAIPALAAIYFRRTIPESPLYTADVLNRPEEAENDVRILNDTSPRDTQQRQDHDPVPAPADGPQAITAAPVAAIQNGLVTGGPINGGPVGPPTMTLPTEDEVEKFSYRWKVYWESFHKYFVEDGFWRVLLGNSLAWLLLDTAYYALGSSSPTVAARIFNYAPYGADCPSSSIGTMTNSPTCTALDPSAANPQLQSMYGALMGNAWRSLIVVCAGSLLGGMCMIFWIKSHSPRNTQIFGFCILSAIFLAAGILLLFLRGDKITAPAIILYAIAQIFFQIGPNFTTFILPAEFFITKHRAFAHGIAAAAGKAGAVVFQIFVQFARFHDSEGTHAFDNYGTVWLGYSVLCFMAAMLVGALVTVLLIPETRDPDTRKNQLLEDLGKLGRKPSQAELLFRRARVAWRKSIGWGRGGEER